MLFTQSRDCGALASSLFTFNSKMADVVESKNQPKDNQSTITEEITNDKLPMI